MKRDAEIELLKIIGKDQPQSEVIIIEGARQVGKTYLCHSVLKKLNDVIQFNLEESPDIKFAIDRTQTFQEFQDYLKSKFNFSSEQTAVLFIDEAQESKQLGSYVRFMKEKWQKTKCILTGSSMSKLFSEDTRVPVGRIAYFQIHPFSFREFLRALEKEKNYDEYLTGEKIATLEIHHDLLKLYDQYLQVGGLPESVFAFARQENHQEKTNFILASQREDFYRKERVKDYLFLDALTYVSNHVGQSGKLSMISPKHHDAKKVLELLKSWHLVYEVNQKGNLPTQSFHPKWYVYDTGILHILRNVSTPSISIIETLDEVLRTPLGGVLENAFLNSLRLKYSEFNISSWKKGHHQAIEVDFILKEQQIEKGITMIPCEVKATMNPSRKHFNAMIHYLKLTKQKFGRLICLAPQSKVNVEGFSFDVTPIYEEI